MNRDPQLSKELLVPELAPASESKHKKDVIEAASPGTQRINVIDAAQGLNGTMSSFHGIRTASRAARKIRVLQIITGLASGGATNVVLDLASYLNDRPDFDVHLLTGPIPTGRTDVTHLAYELGINTRVIPSLINHINPLVNLKAVADIRRILSRGSYDIVHTHSSVAGVVGRLAARAAGLPVVIHHVHGWALHQGMSRGMRILYVALERLCATYTSRIIAVSSPDIQKGLAHRIGTQDKFTLVYNGIDLERFRQPVDAQKMREKLGLEPDCKLVGMIGRLDKQKNPMDFIRAAAVVAQRYSEVQFLMVGDGALRAECERLIDVLDLKGKFFLLGYRNDVPGILSILSITAMSSLWEGLPIAFLESMSAGKPIVANNVDGASDVVVNGETGFLVTPHQPTEMAERILHLLNDEVLCNEMGHIAQQRSKDFSVARMVEQIASLYKELHATAQLHAEA